MKSAIPGGVLPFVAPKADCQPALRPRARRVGRPGLRRPGVRPAPAFPSPTVEGLLRGSERGRLIHMKRKPRRIADGIDPKVLMAYSRWVAKHFDELVKNYTGKYIAVYRNKLVAVGNSDKEVYAVAEKQGIEEPPLTMQVPGIEDLEAIL